MLQKILILGLIIAFVGIAINQGWPNRVLDWFDGGQNVLNIFDRSSSKYGLPDPLLGPLGLIDTNLTTNGVYDFTNQQRTKQGLLPLGRDKKLELAAEQKLADMFSQQYFEHNSPDGKKPADVIYGAGYQYLVVGENLALGNYQTDEILVQAWMDSPGHRANILNNKFQEIGIAVGKGQFDGKEVWLAVQEFGTPLEACPSPNDGVSKQISANQTNIASQESDLKNRQKNLKPENYSSEAQYQRDVATYNRDVEKLNQLISQTKQMVTEYNNEVKEFNYCLETNA